MGFSTATAKAIDSVIYGQKKKSIGNQKNVPEFRARSRIAGINFFFVGCFWTVPFDQVPDMTMAGSSSALLAVRNLLDNTGFQVQGCVTSLQLVVTFLRLGVVYKSDLMPRQLRH